MAMGAVITTLSMEIGAFHTTLILIDTDTTVHVGMVDLAGGMDGMDFIHPFTTLLTTMDTEAITIIDHTIITYLTIVEEGIVIIEDVLLLQEDELPTITQLEDALL